MLSKRYESSEVDRRTWLHVPSGTHWSTSSDTHQVVEIQIETCTKMYTPNVLIDIKISIIDVCYTNMAPIPKTLMFSLLHEWKV